MALPAGKGQRRQLESQKNPKVQVHKARLERMEQKTGTEPGLHLSQAQWEPLGTGRGQPGVMALVGGPQSAGRAGQQRKSRTISSQYPQIIASAKTLLLNRVTCTDTGDALSGPPHPLPCSPPTRQSLPDPSLRSPRPEPVSGHNRRPSGVFTHWVNVK